MIAESLIKLVVSLTAETLWQEIVVNGITVKIKEEHLRLRIGNAISDSLSAALNEVPGFEEDLEDNTVREYLRSPGVSKEMAKVASWHEFPNVSVLRDEWVRISPKTSVGKVEILLNSFLNRVRKKLLEIPDIRDVVFQRETLSSLSNIRSSLDSIQLQFTQLTDDKSDVIDFKSKEEADLQTNLDAYRNLIRKGHPKSALSLLQEKEKEIFSSKVSNQLRSQLQGLLGFSNYLLGQYDEAIKRFEAALILNPENPKTLSNAALAALLDNRLTDAIERATKALEKGGIDTSASAILVNAKAIQQNYTNLDNLIDENALDNLDYVRALASIFHQARTFDLAEKYFRLCLAQDPSDFHALLGLASILVHPAKHSFRFTASAAIHEAMSFVNNAVDIANSGDNDYLKAQAIAARSGMYLAKGDLLNAKKDCDSVLDKFPNNEIALHNRGIIAFIEGDYILSIERISTLSEDYTIRNRLASLLAEAQIANKNPKDAVKTTDKFMHSVDAIEQITLRTSRAKALILLGNTKEAQRIKDELLQDNANTYAILGASEIAVRQGYHQESLKILEDAYNRIPDEIKEKSTISLMLALTSYHHKDFHKSISWFDKLPREFLSDNELAHKYINALYSSKNYGGTYKALQDARKFAVSSPSFIELESWLAEYFGDRNLAIELQEQLTKLNPKKINYQVELARLEFLNSRPEIAKEILNGIDFTALEDPNSMMLIAEMYSYIGENIKAMQLAYKARKHGIDIPRIHLTYIMLFHRIGEEEEIKQLLNLDMVQPDTAVLLNTPEQDINDLPDKHAPAIRVYSTEDFWVKLPAVTKPSGDWEFSLDSDTGKLLLGHKVGDVVPFKSSQLESLNYEIKEIQSIYVRAFQESINEFGTRFPKHEGLQKMDVSDGDLSKIFIPVYRRSSYIEQVYALYRQGQLPLCTVASLVGSSQLEVFWSLLADKEKRIYASHGSADDQKQQAETLIEAGSVTLDVTGLLTLSYLELLPILNKRYEQVFIHQALIDEIDSLIIARGFEFKKGARFVGYHDGLPRFEEISPKSIEESIKYLTDLRSFLKDKCSVIPIPPELDNQIPLPDEMRQSIGHLSLSTVLVAKHTKTPLYADDAVIRAIAKQAFEVNGAWSQVVLKDMADRGIITDDVYIEAYAKLAKGNYFFIAVNERLIIFSLDKSTYMASDEQTKATLDGLKGPDTNEDDAINIATGVLRKIWLSPITADQKRFILDAILRSLYAGRSNDLVTIKLLRALEIAFGGAKDAFHDLANQIRLFYTVINKFH